MSASRTIGRGSNAFLVAPRPWRPSRAVPVTRRAACSLWTSSLTVSSSRTTRPAPAVRQASLNLVSSLPSSRLFSSTPSPDSLLKTPLHPLHLAHSAKLVPFGGYLMPVQYASQPISASHAFTRTHASLFDVSHMAQRLLAGPGAAAFLQRVTPSAASGLAPGRSALSALMHPSGGIVDDCVVARLPEGGGKVFNWPGAEAEGELFYVVTNAECRDKDDAYLAKQLDEWRAGGGAAVEHRRLAGRGLVALQGPEAAAVLDEVLVDGSAGWAGGLRGLLFGHTGYARVRLAGGGSSSELLVSRGGYTGEDGFEISIPEAEAVAVTEALLEAGGPERVRLAGLGARDSLRLEAGMCLYGHDLDDSTTPVEAALGWIVPKERRAEEDAAARFLGAETVLAQLVPKSKGGLGVERRRVGLVVEGAPAREGAEIVTPEDGQKIGTVTSGCPSPTLGKNIAMGYVKDGFHKAGTEVGVVVRGKRRTAKVTKMPFVPTRYWKGEE